VVFIPILQVLGRDMKLEDLLVICEGWKLHCKKTVLISDATKVNTLKTKPPFSGMLYLFRE